MAELTVAEILEPWPYTPPKSINEMSHAPRARSVRLDWASHALHHGIVTFTLPLRGANIFWTARSRATSPQQTHTPGSWSGAAFSSAVIEGAY